MTTRRELSDGGEYKGKKPLVIVPRIAVLGVGCRRGTDALNILKCFLHVLDELSLYKEAFYSVCTIDLKRDEKGLLEFCKKEGLPLQTYSSDELSGVAGEFSASGFVEEITGVDNVCERSAVRGCGDGRLVLKKTVWEGVTMAVAFKNISLNWRL